jgi:hypothetical protein
MSKRDRFFLLQHTNMITLLHQVETQSNSEQTDSIFIQSPMHSLPKALQFSDHLFYHSQAPWKYPNCCFPTLTLILQYPTQTRISAWRIYHVKWWHWGGK